MAVVSVVIPVYNVEQYVATAIHSVLQQSFQDFEIIIVDDASPDNSIQICNDIQDKRIRIISQENRGLAGARNTGIRNAQGQYIALLDSDDYWHADKLQQHISLMQAKPDCDVSFSASCFVDEQGKSLNRIQSPGKKSAYDAGYIFCRNPLGNGSAPVIRKSLFDKIAFTSANKKYAQYFDESLRQSEDVECWVRMALQGQAKFYYIDQTLTYYRLNAAGLSANVGAQFKSWHQVLDKLKTYAPEFVDEYGALAKAYQMRYLSRRLLFQGEYAQSRSFVLQALKLDARILWQEPYRTLQTAIAAIAMSILPKYFSSRVANSLLHTGK